MMETSAKVLPCNISHNGTIGIDHRNIDTARRLEVHCNCRMVNTLDFRRELAIISKGYFFSRCKKTARIRFFL